MRARPVWRREAEMAGVPADALLPIPLGDPALFGMLRAQDLWCVTDLDARWRVAYRFVAQDGVPVIGEVRIYPVESHDLGPGEWSGGYRGALAQAPAGGLTGEVLRSVPTRPPQAKLRDAIESWDRVAAQQGTPEWLFGPRGPLGRIGVGREALDGLRRRGGRRRQWSEADYLRIAAAYDAEVAAGNRQPTATLANESVERFGRKISPETMRDLVHGARTRDFLTEGQAGRATSRLTEDARKKLGLPPGPPTRKQPGRQRRRGGTR